MTDTFTEDTVMSALCIHEYILERLSSSEANERKFQSFWYNLQQEVGACELRQKAIDLSPFIDIAWQSVHPEFFDDSFDWEFVPKILDAVIEADPQNFFSWDEDKWKAFAFDLFSPNEQESLVGIS